MGLLPISSKQQHPGETCSKGKTLPYVCTKPILIIPGLRWRFWRFLAWPDPLCSSVWVWSQSSLQSLAFLVLSQSPHYPRLGWLTWGQKATERDITTILHFLIKMGQGAPKLVILPTFLCSCLHAVLRSWPSLHSVALMHTCLCMSSPPASQCLLPAPRSYRSCASAPTAHSTALCPTAWQWSALQKSGEKAHSPPRSQLSMAMHAPDAHGIVLNK